MNPHIISAFHDEMGKIAGAARVRRITKSMERKLLRAAALTKKRKAVGAEHNENLIQIGLLDLEGKLTPDERSARLLQTFKPVDRIYSQQNVLNRQLDDIELARRRAADKLVRRAERYDVKQMLGSVTPTTYTQRTLGADAPRSLGEAAPTLGRMDKYRPQKHGPRELTERADEFRETADVLRNVQRSGPAKKRGFLDVLLGRPTVGTGVPARLPRPKQDPLLASAKQEVKAALEAARREEIDALRKARLEVYNASLPVKMTRIKALAKQRQ